MRCRKFFVVLLMGLVVLTFMTGCSGDGAGMAEVAEQTEIKSVATVTLENGESFIISEDMVGFEEVLFVSYPSKGFDQGSYIDTYFRDRTTDVMYVYRNYHYGTASHAGFTAMLDPVTGGALTYDNWLKYLEEKNVDSNSGVAHSEKNESSDRVCGNCGAKVHSAYCGQCGALYEDKTEYSTCSGCGAECDTPFSSAPSAG